MEKDKNSIAVIGMSGRFPMAADLKAFFRNLREGKDCVRSVSVSRLADARLESGKAYQPAGFIDEVDGFDHGFFGLSRHDAVAMDPMQRLALELACEAIEDAGYPVDEKAGSAIAIYAAANSYSEYYNQVIGTSDDPAAVTGNLTSMLAGRIAHLLDLTGPALMIDTACSSALVAVYEAMGRIRLGDADEALVGAVNLVHQFPEGGKGLGTTMGIGAGDGRSKTFDENADGTGFGEGGSFLYLKRLDKALADGNRIHAVLAGGATNQDGGRSNGLTAPSPVAQTEVIRKAWERAGVDPEQISYIEAHGTGTKLGDPIEIQGINDAFSTYTGRKRFCRIGSVKSNIGHLDLAAGMAGLCKVILGLKHKTLFPSLHFKTANPLIDFDNAAVQVCTETGPWEGRHPLHAGISAFGLSGTNAHLVVSEAPPQSEPASAAGGPYMLKLSARSAASLMAYSRSVFERLEEETSPEAFENMLYTLNRGRGDYNYRVALYAPDRRSLLQQAGALTTDRICQPGEKQPGNSDIVWLLSGQQAEVEEIRQQINALKKYTVAAGVISSLEAMSKPESWNRLQVEFALLLGLSRLWESTCGKAPVIIAAGAGRVVRTVLSGEKSATEAFTILDNPATNVSPADEKKVQAAITKLCESKQPLFLDMGSSGALAHLVEHMTIGETGSPVVKYGMGHCGPEETMAGLYEAGLSISWKNYYSGRNHRVTDAPTYAFDRVRCWPFEKADPLTEEVSRYLYELSYQEGEKSAVETLPERSLLLTWDGQRKGQAYAEVPGTHMISLQSGKTNNENKSQLMKGLQQAPGVIRIMVPGAGDLAGRLHDTGSCVKALIEGGLDKATPVVLHTTGAMAAGDELPDPDQAAIAGYWKGLMSDYPAYDLRLIDEPSSDISTDEVEAITRHTKGREPALAAWRRGKICFPVINRLKRGNYNKLPLAGSTTDELFLITGGLSGIGFQTARYLARPGRELIIIGRTLLPHRNKWSDHQEVREIKDRIDRIIELEAAGATVSYLGFNLGRQTDWNEVAALIAASARPFSGIIHAAGVAWMGEGADQHTEDMLEPKQTGTAWLLEQLMATGPRLFICYSSMNAIVPQKLSAAYAAANTWQDAAMQTAEAKGCQFISINWPGWQSQDDMDNGALAINKGLRALELAIASGRRQVLVSHQDIEAFGDNPFFIFDKKEGQESSITSAPVITAKAGWTTTESAILGVWAEVLGTTDFSKSDDFFSVGGHSLNGARVANRLQLLFDKKIELDDLFEYCTIATMAAFIDGDQAAEEVTVSAPGKKTPEITRTSPQTFYPASSAQQRTWFLSQLEGASASYNIPLAFFIKGKLDTKALEQSFEALIQRHEVLRTSFRMEGHTLVQVIAEAVSFSIKEEDKRGSDNTEEMLASYVHEAFHKPFDLSNSPLIRATLCRLEEEKYLMTLVMHHVISDGWSLDVLVKDLSHLYEAYATGQKPALEPLRIHYRDFATWQQERLNTEAMQQHRTFWLENLAGLSVPELPADFPRPERRANQGDEVCGRFDEVFTRRLSLFADSNGVTRFMVLLAGLHALVARYTGQWDFAIGVPVAGRKHKELENQIGMYLNTVAVRTDAPAGLSFTKLVQVVKKNVLHAFKHDEYPFDRLVEELDVGRNMSRSPLFDVMLNIQDYDWTEASRGMFRGLQVQEFPVTLEASKTDISFDLRRDGETFLVTVTYDTALYSAERVERMLEHWQVLMVNLINKPYDEITTVSYLTEAEEQRLVPRGWSASEWKNGQEDILSLLHASRMSHPDRAAVWSGEESLSYEQLHHLADGLAAILVNEYNVKPGDLVAVLADRNARMPAALLGIIKSGAAYLPLDSNMPADRLRYMLEDSGTKLLVAQQEMSSWLEQSGLAEGLEVIMQEAATEGEWPVTNITADRMYAMYTSGSTGRPKGVDVPRAAVCNLLQSMAVCPGFGPAQTLLAVTTYAFDISVAELFLPLLQGGTVHVAGQMDLQDPTRLAGLIQQVAPQAMQATPSMWQILLDSGWQGQPGMRLWSGGEKLPLELGKRILAFGSPLYNIYGPTETTIWSMVQPVTGEADLPWLGQPMNHTQVYVLDQNLQPVATGMTGEICIAGAGVTNGYLNREELTVEKFPPNPFGEGNLYRTGDLGRWSADGQLQFIGRLDQQVKLRGFRIELGEIEQVLQAQPGIEQAAVVLQEDAGHEKELVAYIIAPSAPELNTLLDNMAEKLPAYMLPARVIKAERFPYTHNAKVDKKALVHMTGVPLGGASDTSAATEIKEHRSDLEKGLHAYFGELLRREAIGTDDNLFRAGLNSMKVVSAVAGLKATYGIPLEIHEVFSHPTLKKLAGLMQSRLEPVNTGSEPPEDFELLDF
ncbi:amino acid adenylation domain-containing protein [Roseivirga sp. BDSF3-8]|uniref:amino acid adenylation domain-containing protein n=1 Tax=Roseivirga sp. BDSF3-8 TaxID=3241598 RepID=UPI0035324566